MNTKTNPLFIYILVICLGLFLGNYAYNHFNLKDKMAFGKTGRVAIKSTATAPVGPAVKQIMPPPSAVTPEVAPNTVPNPEPTLALNGVFFEQGQSYALINNKIVQVGNVVDGAKVKEIGITGVELEYEGKIIRLLSPS